MALTDLFVLKEILSSDSMSTSRLTTNSNFTALQTGLTSLINLLHVNNGPNINVDSVQAINISATTFSTPATGSHLFFVDARGYITAQSILSKIVVETPRLRLDPDPTLIAFQAGEVRWSGVDFEGWNGFQWISFTAGANLIYLTGPLVINQFYSILNYVAGDDFTNVGAASNATGVQFIATGTTPAVWTNGSTLESGGGGEVNTTSNLGIGSGLALPKAGANLPFKSIKAGSGIAFDLLTDSNTIIINNTGATSGYSGVSGYSGASGHSGISGFSGTSGAKGTSGYTGYSGQAGLSGFSGIATSGFSGTSGKSGTSTSGYSGFSGTSGYSGISGYTGRSGYSGQVGPTGPTGLTGNTGPAGVSGTSGVSGVGVSGFSGFSGSSTGTSGFTGYSGYSGFGLSGYSGYSGFGFSGTSGFSGFSGDNPGSSGFSGKSEYSGAGGSGVSGISGYSGSGMSGFSGMSGSGGGDEYPLNHIPAFTTVTVDVNEEYLIYGNLLIEGTLDNSGTVVVINGDLTLAGAGAFNNLGDYQNIDLLEVANEQRILYHIPVGKTVTVLPNEEYFVYGNLLIEGVLDNQGGRVVVANGTLTLSGGGIFTNTGTYLNVSLKLNNDTYKAAFSLTANVPLTINHGLNSLDLIHQERSGNNDIGINFTRIDANNISILSPISVSGNIAIIRV